MTTSPLLSVCIPAYNEEGNIGRTIDAVATVLSREEIPFEFVIANDNSKDKTADVVRARMSKGIPIRLVHRTPPGGFGRAVRSCLENFRGEIVVIFMADLSDDPEDIVKYYRLITQEGYDAVFGSRFVKGSTVSDYPRVKLVANRLGNHFIRLLFRTAHNDLTNAFKAYRAEVIRSLMPLYSSHFNLLIELSLGTLIRGYRVASCPINWYGRTWGRANFKIRELGRRYFATLIKIYAERVFILDDVVAEHNKKVRYMYESRLELEKIESNTHDEEDTVDRGGGFRRIESRL